MMFERFSAARILAKLLNWVHEKLVTLATKMGTQLRQHYRRVGKFALIRFQKDSRAKQFKYANKMLRTLRAHLIESFGSSKRALEPVLVRASALLPHRRQSLFPCA